MPPKARTDWAPFPMTPAGRLDKARVKEIYDASPHVEWIPFCQSNNWPAYLLRDRTNASAWVADKKRKMESEIAAELGDFATRYQKEWIKDVANTLEQYPRAVDNAMVLIGKHMQSIATGETKAKTGDYYAIAAALKTCIEAKKSILMLNDVVVKVQGQRPTAEEQQDTGWTMELKGEKDVSPKRLNELMLQYLDKPAAPEAEPAGETDAEA